MSSKTIKWDIDAKAHLAFILHLPMEGDYQKIIGSVKPSGRSRLNPVIMGICIRKGAKHLDFLQGPCPVQGLRCSVKKDCLYLTVPIESGSGVWLARQAGNFKHGTHNYHRQGGELVGKVPIVEMQDIIEKMLDTSICFGPHTCSKITASMLHRVESDGSKKKAMG
jgi:hypothetical protein